jgi:hypothetical protein
MTKEEANSMIYSGKTILTSVTLASGESVDCEMHFPKKDEKTDIMWEFTIPDEKQCE